MSQWEDDISTPLGCKWTGSEILPRVWRFGWIRSPAIAVFAVIFATPTAADDTRYLDALRGLD